MTEPLWLRSAAVVAARARLSREAAVAGFAPAHAEAIGSVLAAGKPNAPRAASPAVSEDAGAGLLAAVLRSLQGTERASLARRFSAETLRRVRAHSNETLRCEPRWVLHACSAFVRWRGRMPELSELSEWVRAAAGDDRSASRDTHAVLRSLRALGADPSTALAGLRAST